MKSITWKTEEPHSTNNDTMNDYLENHNTLDITMVDGTYAEGVDNKGAKYAIHASGNGDFFNHRIDFELL